MQGQHRLQSEHSASTWFAGVSANARKVQQTRPDWHRFLGQHVACANEIVTKLPHLQPAWHAYTAWCQRVRLVPFPIVGVNIAAFCDDTPNAPVALIVSALSFMDEEISAAFGLCGGPKLDETLAMRQLVAEWRGKQQTATMAAEWDEATRQSAAAAAERAEGRRRSVAAERTAQTGMMTPEPTPSPRMNSLASMAPEPSSPLGPAVMDEDAQYRMLHEYIFGAPPSAPPPVVVTPATPVASTAPLHVDPAHCEPIED